MNRFEKLVSGLDELRFSGKMTCLERLYRSMQDLVYHLEAGHEKQWTLAEKVLACCWQLKERMEHDREEQWEWTFVWMREKVMRSLSFEAKVDPSAPLRAWVEAEVKVNVKDEQDFCNLPKSLLVNEYHGRAVGAA